MPKKITKILSFLLCFVLIFQQTGFAQAAAVELNLSGYFARMASNLAVDKFRPLHLRYLSYDSLSNNFNLLLDKGDQKGTFPKGTPSETQLKEESNKLLKYFFIGVSLPNDKFWVNLRPDSPNNIIDGQLARTDIGRIFLEADLQLKKDTANFTSPQTPDGKEYWDKLYKKAEELYGYDNVTIPTLTRPWIVPGEIIIRETKGLSPQGTVPELPSAYIYKATLKVMLEQDYLKDSATYSFKDERSKALNEYSSQLIRKLIIPKLTKEVNSSKRYAPLRQVYYSLILAQWFKQKFPQREDRNIADLASKEDWSKTTYFNAYKKSFAQGEYNIKEPVYTPTGQVIRSYFSGGIKIDNMSPVILKLAGSPVGNKPYLVPMRFSEKGIVTQLLAGSLLESTFAIKENLQMALESYLARPFPAYDRQYSNNRLYAVWLDSIRQNTTVDVLQDSKNNGYHYYIAKEGELVVIKNPQKNELLVTGDIRSCVGVAFQANTENDSYYGVAHLNFVNSEGGPGILKRQAGEFVNKLPDKQSIKSLKILLYYNFDDKYIHFKEEKEKIINSLKSGIKETLSPSSNVSFVERVINADETGLYPPAALAVSGDGWMFIRSKYQNKLQRFNILEDKDNFSLWANDAVSSPAAGSAKPSSSPLTAEERGKVLLENNAGINKIYSIAFGDKPESEVQGYRNMMSNFLSIPFGPKDEMFSQIDSLSNSGKIVLAEQAIAEDLNINQRGLSLEELLFIKHPQDEETARYMLHSSLLSRRIWQFAGSEQDFAPFVPYLKDDAEHLKNALRDWKEVYLILWAAKILHEKKGTVVASPLALQEQERIVNGLIGDLRMLNEDLVRNFELLASDFTNAYLVKLKNITEEIKKTLRNFNPSPEDIDPVTALAIHDVFGNRAAIMATPIERGLKQDKISDLEERIQKYLKEVNNLELIVAAGELRNLMYYHGSGHFINIDKLSKGSDKDGSVASSPTADSAKPAASPLTPFRNTDGESLTDVLGKSEYLKAEKQTIYLWDHKQDSLVELKLSYAQHLKNFFQTGASYLRFSREEEERLKEFEAFSNEELESIWLQLIQKTPGITSAKTLADFLDELTGKTNTTMGVIFIPSAWDHAFSMLINKYAIMKDEVKKADPVKEKYFIDASQQHIERFESLMLVTYEIMRRWAMVSEEQERIVNDLIGGLKILNSDLVRNFDLLKSDFTEEHLANLNNIVAEIKKALRSFASLPDHIDRGIMLAVQDVLANRTAIMATPIELGLEQDEMPDLRERIQEYIQEIRNLELIIAAGELGNIKYYHGPSHFVNVENLGKQVDAKSAATSSPASAGSEAASSKRSLRLREKDDKFVDSAIFLHEIGVGKDSNIVNVGMRDYFIIGLAAARLGAHYLGFDKEKDGQHGLDCYNVNEFGGNANHILGEFSSNANSNSKDIKDHTQDFVLIMTGALSDPWPVSDAKEVLREALRIIKHQGRIVAGSYKTAWEFLEREKAKRIIEEVLNEQEWKDRVSLRFIKSVNFWVTEGDIYEVLFSNNEKIAEPMPVSVTSGDTAASPLTEGEQKALTSLIEKGIIDEDVYKEGSLEYRGIVYLIRNNIMYGATRTLIEELYKHKHYGPKGDLLREVSYLLGWIGQEFGENEVKILFSNFILNTKISLPNLTAMYLLYYNWDSESIKYLIRLISRGKEEGANAWFLLIWEILDDSNVEELRIPKDKRKEMFIDTLRELSKKDADYDVFGVHQIVWDRFRAYSAAGSQDSSSPLGGIDMRHLTKNTIIENRGSPLRGQSLFSEETASAELQEIQRLIQAGIIPATRRLEECRGACSAEALLSCIADILRIEEERATQTEAGLKNLLASL